MSFLQIWWAKSKTSTSFRARSLSRLNYCYLGKSGCCGARLLRFLAALLSSLEVLLGSACFLSEVIIKGLKCLFESLPQALFYFENFLLTEETRDKKQFCFPTKNLWSFYSPAKLAYTLVGYFLNPSLFLQEPYQYVGSESHWYFQHSAWKCYYSNPEVQ